MQVHSDITLSDYQAIAASTNREPSKDKPRFALLGIFGETGSVLSEVKKQQRDTLAFHSYHQQVVEELGDLLWYLAAFSEAMQISLDDVVRPVAVEVIRPLTLHERPVRCADFDLDHCHIQFVPDENHQIMLEEFAGEVGVLVRDFEPELDKTIIQAQLTSVFRHTLKIINRSGAQFSEVIRYNINKISSRWPSDPVDYSRCPFFEQDIPFYELFPRKLKIHIFEVEKSAESYFVMQRYEGFNIGDRLTDNIIKEDDYRFHDVFHYAYAAVLHWSPVLRSLLKIKRKSDPSLDEAEDGARAILIEEGISTVVFNNAKQLKLFEGIPRGKLSFDLLKSIRNMTRGYEVEHCEFWQWEEAILQGYDAFRFLVAHRSATIELDLDNRKLHFGELEIDVG